MATCPSGHPSDADDYCDVCGSRITGSPTAPTRESTDAAAVVEEPCPDCGTARTGRFCEECGYDFDVGVGGPTTPRPPPPLPDVTAARSASAPSAPSDSGDSGDSSTPNAPGGWTAMVVADRDYYETVVMPGEGEKPSFPPYCPERSIPLAGEQIQIGRRSRSQGTVPEIDLTEPPEDTGVSHTHAALLARPDGTWRLVDPGSTNGTTVNYGTEPIAVNVEVPMNDGDRIHVGFWTTITLRRQP